MEKQGHLKAFLFPEMSFHSFCVCLFEQEKYHREQQRLKQEWERAQKEVEEEERRHHEEVCSALLQYLQTFLIFRDGLSRFSGFKKEKLKTVMINMIEKMELYPCKYLILEINKVLD